MDVWQLLADWALNAEVANLSLRHSSYSSGKVAEQIACVRTAGSHFCSTAFAKDAVWCNIFLKAEQLPDDTRLITFLCSAVLLLCGSESGPHSNTLQTSFGLLQLRSSIWKIHIRMKIKTVFGTDLDTTQPFKETKITFQNSLQPSEVCRGWIPQPENPGSEFPVRVFGLQVGEKKRTYQSR